MKLRTFFFNGTVFKKDLTRFAPAWGLYTLLLLLGLVNTASSPWGHLQAGNIVELIPVMAVLNFLYAAVNAQLLFGDLFNSRMCNALHAMPLRRECWFITHTTAGLIFGLAPIALVAVAGFGVLNLGAGWSLPLWWGVGAALQYVFFFGTAVLCVFLAGNRFAHGVLYGLVQFFAVLVYWMAVSLYQPLLPGIRMNTADFFPFSPICYMLDSPDLIETVTREILDEAGTWCGTEILAITPGGDWRYYALCAGIGILALLLGLVLYRRRELECAGDFLAFRKMEMPFLVLMTFCAGSFAHAFTELVFGVSSRYIFLAAGLVVGFFGGLMLLRRTNRVFSRNAITGFAILVAGFALTLVLAWLDPLGITRYVPKAEELTEISLGSDQIEYYAPGGRCVLTEPEDVGIILDVHRQIISGEAEEVGAEFDMEDSYYWVGADLHYTLSNGRKVSRYYIINSASEAAQALKPYYSSLEYVLGIMEAEIPEYARKVDGIRSSDLEGKWEPEDYAEFDRFTDPEPMLRALAADCAAGNMAQNHAYHANGIGNEDDDEIIINLEFCVETREGYQRYTWLNIYESCTNTLAWMEDNGLYIPDLHRE